MNDQPMSKGAWRLVMIGAAILALVLIGFVIAVTGDPNKRVDSSNPFWFVALLVIFGVSLTLIAVVFRWLGMANSDEAFALPSGSIRTLLAIGIMVLFTVFGLNFFDKAGQAALVPRLADKSFQEVAVLPAERASEVERYRRDGVLAIPSATAGASAASAVTLTLYRIESSRPAEIVDMQKQMLTAVVTLLTTVIGFYFGSRSAEGARDRASATAADGTDPEKQKLDADLKAFDTDLAEATARLDALKDDTAPSEGATAFNAALSLLLPAAAKMAAERATLTSTLAQGRPPKGALAQIQARVDALKLALVEFKDQLAAAERLVAQG